MLVFRKIMRTYLMNEQPFVKSSTRDVRQAPTHISKNDDINLLNSLTTNVPHHIETSQLICNANQLTSFYKMENICH